MDGLIERIDGEVAWGTFEDGSTFDLPAHGHVVGDKVTVITHDESEDDYEYPYSFILFGERFATVMKCEATDDGVEIAEVIVVNKNPN